jgi:hypothetical protein
MSEIDKARRQANYSNAMTRMWERSTKLRREAEAKGPMTEVYAVHCHVGSIEWFEDAEGVFWVDADGDFRKVGDGSDYEASPRNIELMRSKGVPEETIRRIAKQCEEATSKGAAE